MYSIELSPEQRKRLLEMAEYFFPEYGFRIDSIKKDFQWICDKETGNVNLSEYVCSDQYLLLIYNHGGSEMQFTPDYIMSWYEFTMRYLPGMISQLSEWETMPPYVGNVYPLSKQGRWTFYTKFHFTFPKEHIKHPIDVLYTQYKKVVHAKV